MSKIIAFISSTSDRGSLTNEISRQLESSTAALSSANCVATLMETQTPDPFSTSAINGIEFDNCVDFEVDRLTPSKMMTDIIYLFFERLGALVDRERTIVIAGYQRHFLSCHGEPYRYHYLMKRKKDLTRSDFFDHYTHHHAGFGLATRGIMGYSQSYANYEETVDVTKSLSINQNKFDSISQLSFNNDFLTLDTGNLAIIGPAAIDDEEQFVDRTNSVMMSSSVIAQFPGPSK